MLEGEGQIESSVPLSCSTQKGGGGGMPLAFGAMPEKGVKRVYGPFLVVAIAFYPVCPTGIWGVLFEVRGILVACPNIEAP